MSKLSVNVSQSCENISLICENISLFCDNEQNFLVTLAADDFDAHARVAVPVHSVELDEARDDWFVEVGVLHRVRVDIPFEELPIEPTLRCVKIIRIKFASKYRLRRSTLHTARSRWGGWVWTKSLGRLNTEM